ncbi:MAG: aldehyde dehydrogenase family protein, partial [Rikenellaceae bacterium]
MDCNISNIVAAQCRYFESGATLSINYRKKLLAKLKASIIAYENDVLNAFKTDLSKCEFEAYASEMYIVYDEIDLHIKKLSRWSATSYKTPSIISFPSISSIRKEPRGVVLIISPWNYPFNLLFMPLIGAISAGCTAILKPSPQNKALNPVIENIIANTFSPTQVAVIEGGAEIVDALLDQRYDYIFYTGSENFGREVMSRAAQRLIPVTLELGGKSPVIVNSDADLTSAARRIVWGKLLNAGQTCVAPDYMFVHEDVCDELISMMIREIETRYAIPIKKCAEYGRLISEDHTLRAQEMIQEVRSKVIYGGDVDIKERYVAPTLVVNPPINSKVMQEEIFAPILPIITYNTLSQPIEHIRCNPHPLALYYFGASKKDINNILNFTTSGGVC